ncbi:MAG: DUF302 domain-containing protein [Clostridiales bacterium]|nr:DUF302 domain-containing protein [Clostridiales bacterium]
MKKLLNKGTILGVVIGLLVGVLLTGLVVFKMAPGLMMLEDVSKYGFEETVDKFEKEVTDAGWKISTVHDMQKTLQGFGHEVGEIKIYELCSSKYSAEILKLDDERIVSPMMPCRVAIYTKSDGNTYIGRMNSPLVSKFFGGVIDEIMQLAAGDTEEMLKVLID